MNQGPDALLEKTKLRMRESIESFLMYVSHDLCAVQYGIHTLDDVQRILVPLQGPPSALPEFSDDDWYNRQFVWSHGEPRVAKT